MCLLRSPAVILIKGQLSKYAKLIILKNLVLNKTRGLDLPGLILFKLHEIWQVDSQDNH